MSSLFTDLKVGFIGSGKMAEAMVAGFIKSGLLKPQQIIMSNRTQPRLDVMKEKYGVQVTLDNELVTRSGALVFLAVKPHILPGVVREMAPMVDDTRTVLVSVAAGVTLEQLKEAGSLNVVKTDLEDNLQSAIWRVTEEPNEAEKLWNKASTRIVRVMPNTPSMVGAGASVYTGNGVATKQDLERVHALMSSVGMTLEVPENLIAAYSGLMGSGPAYMYMGMEALADGGVKMGIPRDQATKFAAQTMLGSAKMVLDTGLHPGQLKDNVCSPGGSTICAVHELEKGGYRAALMAAVEASTIRSSQLGQQK